MSLVNIMSKTNPAKPNKQRTIENKKAHFNYESIDHIEVGVALTGEEIKAIRAGHIQLTGSYGRMLQGPNRPELWLVGAQISVPLGDKTRSRKLLAHRSEISKLIGLIQQKNYTLVPSKMYFKKGRIKLLLLISKGLKQHEKRKKLQERDIERDINQSLRDKR